MLKFLLWIPLVFVFNHPCYPLFASGRNTSHCEQGLYVSPLPRQNVMQHTNLSNKPIQAHSKPCSTECANLNSALSRLRSPCGSQGVPPNAQQSKRHHSPGHCGIEWHRTWGTSERSWIVHSYDIAWHRRTNSRQHATSQTVRFARVVASNANGAFDLGQSQPIAILNRSCQWRGNLLEKMHMPRWWRHFIHLASNHRIKAQLGAASAEFKFLKQNERNKYAW